MFLRLGASDLGYHSNVILLPPQLSFKRSTNFSNLRAHRNPEVFVRSNALQFTQQRTTPLLLHRQRLRHQAQCVSAAASSANFDSSTNAETDTSASGPLQWARSGLAGISRNYQAAIASTRLQTAAFYNPKFLPMVTLCVSEYLTNFT